MALNAIRKGEMPKSLSMMEKAKVMAKRAVDPGAKMMSDVEVLVALSPSNIQEKYQRLSQKPVVNHGRNLTEKEIYNEFKRAYDENAKEKRRNDLRKLYENDIFGKYRNTRLHFGNNVENLDPNNMLVMTPPPTYRRGGTKRNRRVKSKQTKRRTQRNLQRKRR